MSGARLIARALARSEARWALGQKTLAEHSESVRVLWRLAARIPAHEVRAELDRDPGHRRRIKMLGATVWSEPRT